MANQFNMVENSTFELPEKVQENDKLVTNIEFETNLWTLIGNSKETRQVNDNVTCLMMLVKRGVGTDVDLR